MIFVRCLYEAFLCVIFGVRDFVLVFRLFALLFLVRGGGKVILMMVFYVLRLFSGLSFSDVKTNKKFDFTKRGRVD